MSFLNFRIRGRLYGGFAILLLFCAGLAGFGVSQLTAIREQVDVMSLQSKNTIRVGEIMTELQAIRRAILRYTFDQDEASIAESEKRLGRVGELLDQAVASTKNEERKANYREAAKDIADLKTKRADLMDAVKAMLAGRTVLYAEGDKMAADVQKFVDTARGTPFEHNTNMLESRVLLVRVANWRTLATRDAKGFATFKANVVKTNEQIAALERLDLSPELQGILVTVKSGVAKYAEAFDKTGPNLARGDELYYHSITPVVVNAVEKMDKVKGVIDAAFAKTTEEPTTASPPPSPRRKWLRALPCCLALPSPT